ncbi:MAG: RraA family protein [Acidobacteriota bacterium]
MERRRPCQWRPEGPKAAFDWPQGNRSVNVMAMQIDFVSPDTIARLAGFDSPTISNVIELFEVRQRNCGFMTPAIRSLFPELPPIVGYASTATYRSSRPLAQGEAISSLVEHVEALRTLPSPRIVVFQDLDEPPAAATFGEVMAAIYKRFGCVGLITSGAARDLEAVRHMDFAVFASGISVSHGFGRIEAVHCPVNVGGLTIRPGDLIHADLNGVVTVPKAIAGQVADACTGWIDAEAIVLNYLKRPEVDIAGLKGALEELGAAIRKLRDSSPSPELV